MKTIVFISTNKSGSSREAIKAAQRLGYFTVLFTDNNRFIEQRLEFPDINQMIYCSLSDYNKMKENIRKLQKQGLKIEAVMSFIDPYVNVAVSLTELCAESVVSSKVILDMEDKVLTRNILKDLPVSPYFAIYKSGQNLQTFIGRQKNHLPLIVKSPISAGSKDVILAKTETELMQAITKLRKKAATILVEQYLTGPQYLIETVVYQGKVHIIAVIEQEITYDKRFIVTGYSLAADIEQSFYDNILTAVTAIIDSFGVMNGACHLEMRLVEDEWKLIEINPRISGGAMNRIIEEGYGINLVEQTIKLLLGDSPDLTPKHIKYVYVQYITVNQKGQVNKITGKERASEHQGVKEVYIKARKGKYVRPPLSMGDRYGYVLAVSDVKEDAKKIAQEAANEITFDIEQPVSRIHYKRPF
ncbi:ATP-grasp domain-containing protein [Peribacillus saganii]|uniref:ATP-grasp domain-containing protein n=1 Tax=Peribacillus saganii TaxID=2303992 RepID=A0A372LAF1_9BACI|nr:ATP-grasp domain-containing protein [Peribacillus saganii]RFU62599.1 ATP-grasp domain-containing protein [Peribacillus saganii]